MHILRTSCILPVAREEAFRFFCDAANLERITPNELCFKIVSPMPIEMRQGALIDYRLRLHGIPFGWKTRISVWEPPIRFVDEQISGPYDIWVHEHTFQEVEGGSTITDEVQYRLPLWPLSSVIHPLVRAELDRIFAFRERAMRRILLGSLHSF